MLLVFWIVKLELLGSYPSCFIALRTFSFVCALIDGWSEQVRDTVEVETPANFATSFIVTPMYIDSPINKYPILIIG